MPSSRASSEAPTAITVELVSARRDFAVASWSIQFSSVGSKLTHGMPNPVTVNVSINWRRLVDTAEYSGNRKIIAITIANTE